MGSGKAIKKKVEIAVIHVIHMEAISYKLHQRVALKFYFKNIYQ